MKKILPLALLITSISTFAQAPSPATTPAAATAPAAVAIEPINCPKPTLPPATKELSNKEAEKLNDTNKAFKACIKAYADARNVAIDAHNAAAKANAAAANAAFAALNSYVSEFNAYTEARAKAGAE